MRKKRAGHSKEPERSAVTIFDPMINDAAQVAEMSMTGQVTDDRGQTIRGRRGDWTVRCVPLSDSYSDTGFLVIRKGAFGNTTGREMKPFNHDREISSFGAADDVKRRGRRNREISEVEGLRLGAKPFIAAVNLYLESREGLIMPSTLTEERKKLRYIGNLLQDLKKAGKVGSIDPRRIDRGDIQVLQGLYKSKRLDPSTQKKYNQLLNGLLKFFGNFTIEQMKAEGVRFPKESRKPIRALSEESTDMLLNALKDYDDWEGFLGLGIVALGLATGCRPKEIRMAHLEDLDLKKGRFYVRYPKGEGSWASPQWISIVREDLTPFLERYLHAREEHLARKGVKEHHALFPAVGYGNKTGFYTASNLNRIKRNLEGRTGVEFRIKDLRPTMASLTVDMDPMLLNDVSSQLRHESTKTTTRYYAEIKVDKAGERLKRAWASKRPKTLSITKTPLLDKNSSMTGYA